MDLLIFQRILFDSLMPWQLTSADERIFAANLRKTSNSESESVSELINSLQSLLSHKPDLVVWLKSQLTKEDIPIIPLLFASQLPEDIDASTMYFKYLIDLEVSRIFSIFSYNSKSLTDNDIMNFRTSMLLRDLKRYLKRTVEKIRELNLTLAEQSELSLVAFVLYYLKYQVINLFFSVQEIGKAVLSETTTLDFLYLTELGEPKSYIREIYPMSKTAIDKKSLKQGAKLTFGCNLKKEKLRPIIVQLCDQIELLNEDVSPADELVDLLLAREIKPGMKKIQLGCDNKNFRYAIEKLMPYFDSLSFINIDRSQCFYSKNDTLLKANNFSKAKSYDPKLKATIDNIFHQVK